MPPTHLPSRKPPVAIDVAKAATRDAQAAGLRHVDDRRAGLRRRPAGKIRRGKREVPAFTIEDARGHRVRDPETLARIRRLAIPPAWRDVWICPDAQGHLQATGRDARGRKQYRYHPRWRQERDSNKYAHLIDFGRALPGLRRRIDADLRRAGLPRRKVLATVVRLLETTFIRAGNEEYARANGSFGLTTLQDRHVQIHAADVDFHFRGKSGVYHRISIHDPAIARTVRRCRDLPGHELFQYLDEDGAPATLDSADVNGYIRELAGRDFTAKDFRTWAGTVLAAEALRGRGAERKLGRRAASEARAAMRPTHGQVIRAIEQVAARLGNTPAVCRKCYVHPEIVTAYLDGTLTSALAESDRGKTAARPAGLRPVEAAVLALLRGRARDERRRTTLARQLRASLRAA